jgi:glucose-1-phosphate thymidylyltransferase
MDALILGAGYATRLYPLTKDRPKPLLPVGGIPILERICRQLAELNELDTIHIVTNHSFAPQYEAWLQDFGRRRVPPPLLALHDDQTTTPENRLGAIGDLQFVIQRAKLDTDLLVIAGDNLIEGSLAGFVQAGRAQGATVGIKDFKDPSKASLYGVVELGEHSRVTGFEEKPAAPRTSLIAIGLYYFPRQTLPLIAEYLAGGQGKDAPGYYLQWLCHKTSVFGHILEGDWVDIGDLDSYHKADENMRHRPVSRR